MKVLAFEGINGAGKSTCAAALRDALQIGRLNCVVSDPAAAGLLGRAYRVKLVEPDVEHHAGFDSVVFAALRMEGARSLLKHLESNPVDVVILERWTLAIDAYGRAAGARVELLHELMLVLDSILKVDDTILIDADGALTAHRIPDRSDQNRFERAGVEYADRLAREHRAAAHRLGAFTVDGSRPVGETVDAILENLAGRWPDLPRLADT